MLDLLGRPHSLIKYVTDRPGHDRRYATDPTRIESELGWHPRETFESGIRKTVEWYVDNRDWIARARSGAYLDYYERMYGNRGRGPGAGGQGF
jgi:dTDP-glucose 4,6-dehydratase